MQAFGHMVLAWIWLSCAAIPQASRRAPPQGRLAARAFYHYECPRSRWLASSPARLTCAEMPRRLLMASDKTWRGSNADLDPDLRRLFA
jgi:hypothetical protein